MRRFEGRGVIVTGAGSGIGRATAHRFAAEGAHLFLIDRDADSLGRVGAELQAVNSTGLSREGAGHARTGGVAPPTHDVHVADVSDPAQVDGAVAGAVQALGRIDVLISNAGIGRAEEFLDITPESWDRIMAVNLRGVFLMGQRVAREMVAAGSRGGARGAGAIVNMASTNGIVGEEKLAHYNASKGGVVLLTKSMAIDLAPHGIRVNAVCPGFIKTPLTVGVSPDPAYFAGYAAKIPLGRIGEPAEVAAVFAFLASDDASFITGECVVVDGGQLTY
ncbi:MAG: SDR family oxidoreductase [Chloroflexota bacterium]